MDYMFPISGKAEKLKPDQQDALIKNSVNRWLDYTRQWEGWLDEARESMSLYSDNKPSSKSKYVKDSDVSLLSNVRLPVIAQAVDSVVSQQHLANFPQDELFFQLKPQNKEGHEIKAALEQHIQDSLEYINFMSLAQKDRKALALTGCIAVWHPWVIQKERMAVYEEPSLLGIKVGKPKRAIKEKVVFEGTGFVPLHIEDVRFDATVDFQDETNIVFRRWMPVEELKEVDGLENKDEIDTYSAYHDASGSRKDGYYSDWGIDSLLLSDSSISRENCLLYEEWGDFYIDGKCYENYVLIYSNERIFHYFGPNDADHQMKPFTVCPYVYMPNSLLGKSLTHDIIPLAHAADTVVNQALDNGNLTLNAAYTYLPADAVLSAFLKNRDLVIGPGSRIPVQSHDSLRPLVHDRGGLQEAFSLYNIIKEEIRESTGGVPYTTGGTSGAEQDRTLGEVEILASGTSTRFQMINQAYDEMRLKPFMKMVVSNLRQYMTEAIISVDENELITESRMKKAIFDVNITGSKSIMSRKKDFEDLMFVVEKLMPALIQNGFAKPDGSSMEVNIPGLAKELIQMTAAKNLPDLYEIITPEEQQEEMTQEGGMTNGLGAIPGIIPGQSARGLVAAPPDPRMAVA